MKAVLSFSRRTWLMSAVFIIVLALLSFVGYVANDRFGQITDSLIEPPQYRYPKVEVERIRSLLGETELSLKAYTLTKDEAFLDDYYFSCFEIIDEFDSLRADSARFEPVVLQVLDTLDTLVFTRLDLFEVILTSGDEFRVERAMRKVSDVVTDYKVETEEVSATEEAQSEKPEEEKGVLKRLFNKRNDKEDVAEASKSETTIPPKRANIDALKSSLASISASERGRESYIRNTMLQLSEDGKEVSQRIDELISKISQAEIAQQEKEALEAARLSEASQEAVRAGIIMVIIMVMVFTLLIAIQVRQAGRLAAARKDASEKALNLAETKERFVANISHELRTPLNAIIGFSDMLGAADAEEERTQYVHNLQSSAYHLNEIIRDLLDWSKLERGKFDLVHTAFDLKEVIGEVAEMMRFKDRSEGVQFELKDHLSLHTVYGDPLRLKQVLINLIGNALKFTQKGYVRLSVYGMVEEDVLQFKAVVADTGPGIPLEQQNNIFKDFEQIDDPSISGVEGSGLGLAIVKRLVTLHNGKIDVQSELGSGSVFTVSWSYPLTSEGVDRSERVGSLKGMKVLVLDDNAFNLQVVKSYLMRDGAQVEAFESGKDALERIKQGDFDVALIDLKMPDLGGFEVIKEVRSHTTAKLLAFSAGLTDETIEQCKAAGFDGVLNKPVFREDLIRSLTTAVGRDAQKKGQENSQEETPKVFDEEVFLGLFDGDKEMSMEMLVSFKQSLNLELPQLSEAINQRDEQKIGEVIHKLSPSYRQAGAEAMLQFFMKIKALDWQAQEEAQIDALRHELDVHIKELGHALDQFQARLLSTPT